MDAAQRRAEFRRLHGSAWPVRAYRLGEEPTRDPLDRSLVDDRLATMWPLARAAWSVAGKAIPDYPRSEAPGTIVRGRDLP